MRKKVLGSVVHTITSEEGSVSFRATDDWEATERAPGGCDAAKEVVEESLLRKFSHVIRRGATFRSWHEQTAECIWGGEIRDDPVGNSGRGEILVEGHAQKAEKKTGPLLYQTPDLELWSNQQESSGPMKWDLSSDDYDWLSAKRAQHNATEDGAFGTTAWQSRNYAGGGVFEFDPGSRADISRVRCSISKLGDLDSAVQVLFKGADIVPGATIIRTFDAFPLSCDDASFDVDFDVHAAPGDSAEGRVNFLYIHVGDLSSGEPELIAKYGAWPAFKPSCNDNDYDGWTQGARVIVSNLVVNGIAPGDHYSVSSVARDLAQRLRVMPTDIDEFGFNALPLYFRNGESFAEALDYMALLANARWLILDNGHKPYLDFGRFNKRVWETSSKDQPGQFLTLPRFDRISIPIRYASRKRRDWVTVVADNPFSEPRSYGRLQLKDPQRDSERAQELGERLLEPLNGRRLGGWAQLHEVGLEGGDRMSPYFLHAGDIYRVTYKWARGRIAKKTMTKRGVHIELESNYAPLDSYLARQAKRLQAVA